MYKDSCDAAVYSDEICVHWIYALLHSTADALNLGYMIILEMHVQLDLHVRERNLGQFELLIFPEFNYLESPLRVVGLE